MSRPVCFALALSAALFTACAPDVSDTGYAGTWTRGHDRVQSTLSIVHDGDGYLVRWGLDTVDGKHRVRCDWNGTCEELVDGEQVATYRLRTWVAPETGRLRIEKRGEHPKRSPGSSFFVDELALRDAGRTLTVRTLQSGEQKFTKRARPKRVFKKLSNEIIDPPRRAEGDPS